MEPDCSTCGYENPVGARFCSSCGQPLGQIGSTGDNTIAFDPTIDQDPVAVDLSTELPEGATAMFVVRQGPKRGTRIALTEDATSIGRHPESDIFLDDVTVSRHHATVRRLESGFEVVDAGSLNGTYVNQNRLDSGKLNDGDEVQIGKFKLVYLALGNPR